MMSNPQPAVLTDSQKDDVRRHCGFPVFGLGVGTTPPTFGYRYNTWYLILEYRMNNLGQNQANLLVDTSSNLDTDRAAVWYHNKNEVSDRFKLYKLWCDRTIEFLGLQTPSKLLSLGTRITV